MRKSVKIIITLFTFVTLSGVASAQCDSVASLCEKHLVAKYISDGQQYRALLLNTEETAEFHATFYGGSTYRVAACSGLTDGNLVFSVFDEQRNMIFTNSEFKNAPYWDFKINSTFDGIIEAKLDINNQGSGCAVLLIGFKQ